MAKKKKASTNAVVETSTLSPEDATAAKAFTRAQLLKKLRTKRKFLQTVRTVGGGAPQAQEIIQQFSQEQDEDQKALMSDMLQEMKGMKRTSAKNYVKDVTKGMTNEQLDAFRTQAGPSMQHLIPAKSSVPEVNPLTVFKPGASGAAPEAQRGFTRINAAVPSFSQASTAFTDTTVTGLPVPKRKPTVSQS